MNNSLTIFLFLLLVSPHLSADFSDPMRPPAYALEKYRLEKFKQRKKTARPVASKPATAVQPWTLNSILYSGKRQHAIINNKLVKKGEVIQGARLILLKPDRVRLKKKGKIIDLTLRKEHKSIKISPSGSKL